MEKSHMNVYNPNHRGKMSKQIYGQWHVLLGLLLFIFGFPFKNLSQHTDTDIYIYIYTYIHIYNIFVYCNTVTVGWQEAIQSSVHCELESIVELLSLKLRPN